MHTAAMQMLLQMQHNSMRLQVRARLTICCSALLPTCRCHLKDSTKVTYHGAKQNAVTDLVQKSRFGR